MAPYDAWIKQKTTDAHYAYELLHAVIFSTHIHESNFTDLINELNKFKVQISKDLDVTKNSVSRSDFLIITKLLTNYISSAFSLRDSSRNLTKKECFFTKESKSEYSQKIERHIKSCKQIKFIEDLRNTLTHQSLLIPRVAFSFRDKAFNAGYCYRKSDLIGIERFSPQSKRYITEIGTDYIYLIPIINTYHMTTSTLQDWIINTAFTKHKKDNSKYWDIRNEIAAEWGGDLEPRTLYMDELK
ncbi:hypothetical protein PCO86_03275 [Pectobacteriaceae bacterium CE70]|nr:hypothetical protein PCO86_03275 [Pectobacteriaceae bacterium CE70]